MGLTVSADPGLIQLGAWQVRLRGPASAVRSLRAVLAPIAIAEEHLPLLEVSITDGFARGIVEGQEAWAVALPGRGWLSALLGYTVATATSLLRALHYIHAGVVEIGGRGHLLVGLPGAGKTSVVAILVRGGAGYLSDEVAVLDPEAGTVHPFALPLAVKPWTARAIETLPRARLTVSDGGIRYLLPTRRVPKAVPIDSLVLLDPAVPATAVAEMPRGEMLLALSEQASTFRHRHRLEDAFSAFVRIVRRARCVRVGSAVPAVAAGALLAFFRRTVGAP